MPDLANILASLVFLATAILGWLERQVKDWKQWLTLILLSCAIAYEWLAHEETRSEVRELRAKAATVQGDVQAIKVKVVSYGQAVEAIKDKAAKMLALVKWCADQVAEHGGGEVPEDVAPGRK